MSPQVEGQSVLEEIAGKLGSGAGKPFPDVDQIHGFLYRPEAGVWRLYRELDSSDYIQGADADVGAMRTFLTFESDTLVWLRPGAEVDIFVGGELSRGDVPASSSSWH
ncbi:MAG TPA: hypothetical protein VJ982_11200 [Gemmatimonadota bacterium]|nr:hypothetical protein [Gemmatimonadota bacterium]